MYQATTATKKVLALKKRIRAIQGGTSASKTISVLLYLIHLAQNDKTPTTTSVVSESFPHLRKGAMKDFLDIMKTHNYYKEDRWDRTNSIYTFETGSMIEFFSVDQPSKVRGPRRDRLFMNEANNIPYEAFDQLEVRTKQFVILDWNPTNEFWFYTDVLNVRDDVEHITLTYLDNEALDKAIVASIEQRKENKQWWQVYGLGQLGEVDGMIYTDWQIIDEVPHNAKLLGYGLDYGYSNDETAIVALYKYDSGYILDELLYQKGLLNKQIFDVMNNFPRAMVVPDSSEPKSNDELKAYGLPIVPAVKGPDSVRNGIQVVQSQRISVTKRSTNIIKEKRNYMWRKDRDGNFIKPNEPIDLWNHAMDASRYIINAIVKKPSFKNAKASPAVKPYYGDNEMAY